MNFTDEQITGLHATLTKYVSGAHENARRRLVKQMRRASANVAWLPTAFSADVRMSEEQILDAPANLAGTPDDPTRDGLEWGF